MGSIIYFSYLDDTNNYYNFGLGKGSVSSNYIVLSTYDSGLYSIIIMLQPVAVNSVYDSFNVLWKQRILN